MLLRFSDIWCSNRWAYTVGEFCVFLVHYSSPAISLRIIFRLSVRFHVHCFTSGSFCGIPPFPLTTDIDTICIVVDVLIVSPSAQKPRLCLFDVLIYFFIIILGSKYCKKTPSGVLTVPKTS